MLDIKLIRENPDLVKKSTERRGKDPVTVDNLLEIDRERRELIAVVDELKQKRNKVGKKPKHDEIVKLQKLKKDIDGKEKKLEEIANVYDEILDGLPNILSDDTPNGESDQDNPEIKKVGKPPKFDFEPKDHLAIAESLDLVDFARGAKVAGADFYYAKNELALLDLALQKYAFDMLKAKGFTLMITPDMAKNDICSGTGFAPRGREGQVYSLEGEEISLVGTAEITLAGYHKDEILSSDELPKKYAALSHCYRRESGSYGKYSKGLYRMHQFSKVEMFVYGRPEESDKYHQELLAIEEEILQDLEIPYRLVAICAGDIGAPYSKSFDLEAWIPSLGEYREITSTSNATDY
ncbi:serine--tRNA ligase, partial [Patescibacteria group bacterium]|nr:serine--tRNA ligase [Patescibacteria group bacterium]